MVGPEMVAAMNTDELHATAFGKWRSGTNNGRNAWPAGPLKARTTPLASITV